MTTSREDPAMTPTDRATLRELASKANAAVEGPPHNYHAGMPEWQAVDDYWSSDLLAPESILVLLDAADAGERLREALEAILASVKVVPMEFEDDDEGPAEFYTIPPDAMEAARAALEATAPERTEEPSR